MNPKQCEILIVQLHKPHHWATHHWQLSAGQGGAEGIRISVALGTKQIHAAGGGSGGAEQIVGCAGTGETGGKRVGSGHWRTRHIVQFGSERVGFCRPNAAGTEGVRSSGAGEGVLGGEERVRGERVSAFERVLPKRIWSTTQEDRSDATQNLTCAVRLWFQTDTPRTGGPACWSV